MARPLWFNEMVKKIFPGRFLLAKSTRLPMLGALVDRWLFKGDDLYILPKNTHLLVNESLPMPEDMVLPTQVVDHFVEKAKIHWIMNECICRGAEGCKDYPIELGCLFLGQAAQGINPQLGRRASKEEALEHVERCREAGLVHLIGRNKLDTVWLGVGPGTQLMTICNCCPCCCIWKVLPDVDPSIGAKVQRMPGVKVVVTDRCIGCGLCMEEACFVGALALADGRAQISQACRGCGRCAGKCPEGAIEITFGHRRFIEETIRKITPLVEV
jgi:ferredoxin